MPSFPSSRQGRTVFRQAQHERLGKFHIAGLYRRRRPPLRAGASLAPGEALPTLVLIRHGQSAWNLENRFTGWWDVNLTAQGIAEAKAAGELMAAKGLDFDRCFTSVQTRAIKTLNLALEAMGRLWLPVEKDWHLNERHYGGLTGLDKAETAALPRRGDQVKVWRRSFDTPPPVLAPGGEYRSLGRPPLRRHRHPRLPRASRTRSRACSPIGKRRIAPALTSRRSACSSPHTAIRCARWSSISRQYPRRRDHQPRDPDRPADRLRAYRRPERAIDRYYLSER